MAEKPKPADADSVLQMTSQTTSQRPGTQTQASSANAAPYTAADTPSQRSKPGHNGNGNGNGHAPNNAQREERPFWQRVRSWLRGRLGMDEELHALLEEREENEAPLSDEERTLITNALKFRDIRAGDVSIARSDVVAVHAADDFDKILKTFVDCGHARLPVYGRDLDAIIGFLTVKDVVKYVGRKKEFVLKKAMRPVTFVPDVLPLPAVMTEMRKDRVQMAIVVDEYGGTAGLLTFKDILEELIGDIEDEDAPEEAVMLHKLGKGRWQVDPRMPMDELQEQLEVNFETSQEDEFETVGGLVLHLAGRVPDKGDSFHLPGGGQAQVMDADGRRILRLELRIAEGG